MKCQLARCLAKDARPSKHAGMLIWVSESPPTFRPTWNYDSGDLLQSALVFESPYYHPDGTTLSIHAEADEETLELLPYFGEVEPQCWEDLLAAQGERAPQ